MGTVPIKAACKNVGEIDPRSKFLGNLSFSKTCMCYCSEKRRNKFRLVVSEVSSFVGYPVSMSNTEV